MANVKISQLPAGVASLDSVICADNAAGTATEKLTIAEVLALNPKLTVVGLTYAATINTNAALADMFDVTLTGNTTIANPTNPVNGQTLRWRITQDSVGNRGVTLGNKFNIPASASSPLPFSAAPNKMDILAATYHAGRDKWDVVAFVMGY